MNLLNVSWPGLVHCCRYHRRRRIFTLNCFTPRASHGAPRSFSLLNVPTSDLSLSSPGAPSTGDVLSPDIIDVLAASYASRSLTKTSASTASSALQPPPIPKGGDEEPPDPPKTPRKKKKSKKSASDPAPDPYITALSKQMHLLGDLAKGLDPDSSAGSDAQSSTPLSKRLRVKRDEKPEKQSPRKTKRGSVPLSADRRRLRDDVLDEKQGSPRESRPKGDRDPAITSRLESILSDGQSIKKDGAKALNYSRRIEGLVEERNGEPILEDLSPVSDSPSVARLAHGLDRVLFNPGVHWVQDPRSRVYNFSPWLSRVPDVQSFAFERLGEFIKSSRDEDLWTLAEQENRKFAGSTSSLSGLLAHIYFLVSGDKHVQTGNFGSAFRKEASNFTPGMRRPASVLMNFRNGHYAIDSDSSNPEEDEKNILMWLGTLLEKFFTQPEQEFSKLLRSTPAPDILPVLKKEPYRYSKSKSFVMRSQLDCVDPRLPGTGVFDIKTRAVMPIRLDMLNHAANSGYMIRTLKGFLESFEREYYDLVRSAFLKYSFQVRIGNMDGIFVAYHNTKQIFGFQYVPLEEMEEALYGHKDCGERVFQKCIRLMEQVAEEISTIFPNQSVQVSVETREDSGVMNVIVQPAEWDDSVGPRPIAQLDVRAESFINEEEVRGAHAVDAHDQHWTLRWSITKMSHSEAKIRSVLRGMKSRQIFPWPLPEDVSYGEMLTIWQNINWAGAPKEEKGVLMWEIPGELDPLNSDGTGIALEDDLSVVPEDERASSAMPLFRHPDPKIMRLRQLAAQGLQDTRALQAAERERGILIWQQEPFEPVINDEHLEEPAASYTVPGEDCHDSPPHVVEATESTVSETVSADDSELTPEKGSA